MSTAPQVEHIARWKHRRRWGAPLLAGLVCLFLGGRQLLDARAGMLVTTNVAELERGARPDSSWLELRGQLAMDEALRLRDAAGLQVFVPLVSDAFRKGRPVAVVVRVREAQLGSLEHTPIRGIEDPAGLPPPIAAQFLESNLNATKALVLELGAEPGDRQGPGKWVLLGGLVLLLFSAVLFVLGRPRPA